MITLRRVPSRDPLMTVAIAVAGLVLFDTSCFRFAIRVAVDRRDDRAYCHTDAGPTPTTDAKLPGALRGIVGNMLPAATLPITYFMNRSLAF